MKQACSPFDAADYLRTEEDIEAYLVAATEEGLPPELTAAVIKRAKEKMVASVPREFITIDELVAEFEAKPGGKEAMDEARKWVRGNVKGIMVSSIGSDVETFFPFSRTKAKNEQ